MKEPNWVEQEVVLRAHKEQLAEHGGSDGVRDEGLLESALYRPRNLLVYSGQAPSFFLLAAAYAFGLARNHPFVDGNKRTALAVCLGFLRINGVVVRAPQVEMYKMFYGLAAGEETEATLAAWLQAHVQ